MKPPGLAVWLIARALHPEIAEAVTGDLTEEFRRNVARGRALRAWARFWTHAVASVVSAWWLRRDTVVEITAPDKRSGWLDGARQDLRFARRSLAGSPAFTIAATVTLAIGVGAFTAIGTAASRTLLRPLPYPTGDRLVHMGEPDEHGRVGNIGFATVLDWRARLKTFDELSIIRGWTPTLVRDQGAATLNGMRVNWNFFRMLGVQPMMGRTFTAEDDLPDRWRVIVISEGMWRNRLGSRPDIIDSTVTFNGRQFRVVGVMPAAFEPLVSQHFFTAAELWGPLGYDLAGSSSCRTCRHLKLVGRLQPAATLDQAVAELAVMHAGLQREHPDAYTERPPVALMLQDEIVRPVRTPLAVLMAAVMFVLLVASANVAGLLLARATDRTHEFTLRAALGAGRGRLLRQLLTESLVIAAAAAGLGVLIARFGMVWLADQAAVTIPRIDQAPSDPALWLIAGASSLVALLIFGLLPALTSARPNLQGALRSSRASEGPRAMRLREWLMAGQVAFAVVLVAGAGLMYRTVDRLLAVDPGFEASGVFSANLSLVGPAWAEDTAVRNFQRDLLERISALAGVESAALAGQIPLGDNWDRRGFRIEGRTYATEAQAPEAERYSVTPDYFRTMRIRLVEGRLFTTADATDSGRVILINETAARTLWPGGSAIGSRVKLGDQNSPWNTVVGIVGDVRHYELGQPPTPQFYTPQSQMTDSFLVLVARTTGDPAILLEPMRQTVTSLARDVPVYDVATLEDRIGKSVAARRFLMLLLGLLAGATMVIASIGLYGVVSQSVSARRREFGIRIALGANRRRILSLAVRRGLLFVVGGLAVGLAGTLLLGRLLTSQLYETTTADPVALSGAAAVLLAAAVLAHAGPIHRALRVDPAKTLRNE